MLEDTSSENKASDKRVWKQHFGFGDADILVIESKVGKSAKCGTGILLQNPATWGKVDEGNFRPTNFLLKAFPPDFRASILDQIY